MQEKKILTIIESTKAEYESGKKTLYECAVILARHGWNMGIIDEGKTLELVKRRTK